MRFIRIGLIAAVMAIMLVGVSPTTQNAEAGDREKPAKAPTVKVDPKPEASDSVEPGSDAEPAEEEKAFVVVTRPIASTAKEIQEKKYAGNPVYGYSYNPLGAAKYAVVKAGKTPIAYFEVRSTKVPVSEKGSEARKKAGAAQMVEVKTLQVYIATDETLKAEDLTPAEELAPLSFSVCASIPAGWKAMGEVEMYRGPKSEKNSAKDAWTLELNGEEIPACGLVLNQLTQRDPETKEMALEVVFRTRLPHVPANPTRDAAEAKKAAAAKK